MINDDDISQNEIYRVVLDDNEININQKPKKFINTKEYLSNLPKNNPDIKA